MPKKWNLALHKKRIVLPEPLYQLLITPNLENYGYGIEIEQDRCGTVFKHQGSVAGLFN